MIKKDVNSPGNTDIGDGGPAFPVSDGPCFYQEMGMSLRDYIAARTFPRFISGYTCDGSKGITLDNRLFAKIAADHAVMFADALIKALEEPK